MAIKIPPSAYQSKQILSVAPFKGMNIATTSIQIDPSESPDMLNMQLDDRGALDKRTGYDKVFGTSLGSGAINGLFEFIKADGTKKYLLAHGTTLYEWFKDGTAPTSLYTPITNAKMRFFVFNDKCYMLNGAEFLVYDGTTVTTVESNAYIPTLTIGRPPVGGGTAFEEINLLTPGFKDSFDGDNSSVNYQLSFDNLDATTITATVDGADKTEDTDFTVNRTTGLVTFTTAPPIGTNNVIIKAYKTIAGNANIIKKCNIFTIFGGTNDTRVFVSGNPDYPNYLRHSGLFDPTYWPENSFSKVGSDSSSIKGFSKQYDTCIIFKQPNPFDVLIWNMKFELVDGKASFPITPLNSAIGCSATDSIQLIENTPFFLDKIKGVYALTNTSVRNERNVHHISDKIDRDYEVVAGLLNENNLEDFTSFDYKNKYILCNPNNGICYVYDYRYAVWYKWDNIYANCFIEIDNTLYFGDSRNGLLFKFKTINDSKPYNDNGNAINAYFRSKLFSFGDETRFKLVDKIFYSIKPNTKTSARLRIRNNLKSSWKDVKTIRMDLFNYNFLDYSTLTYVASIFPQSTKAKVRAKKIGYFQFEIGNNVLDESLGILSTDIKFMYQREVKI